MKKTIQTIMTAAAFAAALGAGAVDTLSAQSAQYADAAGDLNAVTMIPQPVYGPPEWMTEDPEDGTGPLVEDGVAPNYTEEETTNLGLCGTTVIPVATTLTLAGTSVLPLDTTSTMLTLEGTSVLPQDHTTTTSTTTLTMEGTTPIQTEPELITPGEAPLYGEPGDIDMDNSVDARDLTLLKRYLLAEKGVYADYTGDVNRDGKIDKEDVKALVRMLTGKPEDEDEPVVTTTVTAPVTTITTSTTIPTMIHTLYGPPPAWN